MTAPTSSASLRRIARWGVALLALAASTSACAPMDEEPTGVTHDALYYRATALWPMRDVPVCWETSGNATEKQWVREALVGQRSWASAGDIRFVGWGDCGSSTSGIHLKSGGAMSTNRLGYSSAGATTITFDFASGVEGNYTRCSANSLTREQCIKAVALHEFGHAIAYAHEQNRPSPPASCGNSTPQGSDGDTTFGAFDVPSITAYCNFSTNLSALDRLGTDRVYGPALRDVPRLRDYNGDGRGDFLCVDAMSGDLFADYASSAPATRYGATDWSAAASWCNATQTRQTFAGDFNGDGRDDLLCFDTASGSEYVDLASATGQFTGADWSAAAGFCNATQNRRLHVGDFNGDGRDDLLCHDRSTGSLWIDYANAAGQFGAHDWSAANNWCNAGTNRRLHVGDFNADGRADLLCHDLVSGDEYIDYASATGTFGGTDWSLAAGWCNFHGARILVGDLNGDNRDDLVCHSAVSGARWVDLASSLGRFAGTDSSVGTAWCNGNGDRLFIGDADGDNRDDLACHNASTGLRRVDYASATGALSGTDFTIANGWCNVDTRDLH